MTKKVHKILQESQMEPKWHIPKNKCQNCYRNVGRYILDCYCILCEQCLGSLPYYESQDRKICRFCNKPIKGQIIDAKEQSSVNKLSHLFGNIDNSLSKTLQIYKFQQSIINRYCMHLEKELQKHKKAIQQISRSNPQIEQFFRSRLNSPGYTQQKNHKRTISNADNSTIKYNPQIQSKRSRSQSEVMFDQHQIKHIHTNTRNQSGKAIYKVPNININTALRSQKRSTRTHASEVYEMKNMEVQQNSYYNQNNKNNWKQQQQQFKKLKQLQKEYSYWGKKKI